MAIIDCCTREVVAWHLSVRCRAEEAITLVEEAAAADGIQKGELTLGSDNGSALTARRFKARLAEQGIRHRRGGYRDPESQAFIESWFGKPKERELWLNDYETLDQARRGIAGYVARYHHRPHSGLDYRTPHEVRRTWEDQQQLQNNNNYKNKRPNPSTPTGSTSTPDISGVQLDSLQLWPLHSSYGPCIHLVSQVACGGVTARRGVFRL